MALAAGFCVGQAIQPHDGFARGEISGVVGNGHLLGVEPAEADVALALLHGQELMRAGGVDLAIGQQGLRAADFAAGIGPPAVRPLVQHLAGEPIQAAGSERPDGTNSRSSWASK